MLMLCHIWITLCCGFLGTYLSFSSFDKHTHVHFISMSEVVAGYCFLCMLQTGSQRGTVHRTRMVWPPQKNRHYSPSSESSVTCI
ncbi:hypothetical protein F5J12DRAFT_499220 [Pisolithus orientalis]|uniref:uncharacterized protein n=1 Tax=Pisolithus orientalis TaxID=936130 RepID=UPI00222544C3|nr:uncharacterized protein F5J12DRAFT_499220 [Pisolithus orientalis]KAI5990027.1 hypothetical protein F5J12DRAFT_499220 [Pisolithus orientalis]